MASNNPHQKIGVNTPSLPAPTLWTLFLPPFSLPTKTLAPSHQQHPCKRNSDGGSAEILPPRPAVLINAANRPLSTPPNGLRATHVPTAFPTTAAVTKLPDDVNRSIEGTYCVRTLRGDSPYMAEGIVACNRIITGKASCT